jgi:hypothetical protein
MAIRDELRFIKSECPIYWEKYIITDNCPNDFGFNSTQHGSYRCMIEFGCKKCWDKALEEDK